MNLKASAIVVSIVLAGAALIWMVRYQDGGSVAESLASSAVSNTPGVVGEQHALRVDTVLGDSLSSTNFASFDAQLSGSRLSEGESIYFKTQAARLCESYFAISSQERLKKSENRGSSDEYFVTTLRPFCMGVQTTAASEQAKLLQAAPDDPVVEAYGLAAFLYEQSNENSNESELLVTQLHHILKDDEGGAQIIIAAEALQNVEDVLPEVQALADSAGSGLSAGDLARAQVLASQMRVCELHGGCGPGQLETMHECILIDACGPGITADTIWRKSNSPMVYHMATEIQRQLW